jgi:2-polyprenyl-6-methoxyphenol hydroxylase-like FAD-dependent oxidoreductase
MLPFLGQGAANALEDAMILTRCLAARTQSAKSVCACIKRHAARAFAAATEQAARRGERYWAEPNADSLKGNEPGEEYAYDAVSGRWAVKRS